MPMPSAASTITLRASLGSCRFDFELTHPMASQLWLNAFSCRDELAICPCLLPNCDWQRIDVSGTTPPKCCRKLFFSAPLRCHTSNRDFDLRQGGNWARQFPRASRVHLPVGLCDEQSHCRCGMWFDRCRVLGIYARFSQVIAGEGSITVR